MIRSIGILVVAGGTALITYGVKQNWLQSIICEAQEAEKLEKTMLKQIPEIEKYDADALPHKNAIAKARELALRFKDEVGAPGLVVGVSIDGKKVWTEGIGIADVENRVACHSETVMRIASISKSMTMAVVAKLWQEGKLDLDKPVQHYVPTFPEKQYNSEKVTITTRHLVSHLAGIRHYKKPVESNDSNNSSTKNKNQETDEQKKTDFKGKKDEGTRQTVQPDTNFKEFYIKDKYDSVLDSLKLFQDDDLLFKPGSSFHYTSHGWTLVSAVVEGILQKQFPTIMKEFFKVMGLKHTYLDENEPIIYNRARYYMKNAKGRIVNVPYVDNSYKWAGGGFLSTVGDLLHFGNAMLYSYQWSKELDARNLLPGYLELKTMNELWTPVPKTGMRWGREDGYGMGWVVIPFCQEYGGGDVQKFAVGHTGAAIGASSVLLIVPSTIHPSLKESSSKTTELISSDYLSSVQTKHIPSGVIVAIIMNLQNIGLQHLALDIASAFSTEAG